MRSTVIIRLLLVLVLSLSQAQHVLLSSASADEAAKAPQPTTEQAEKLILEGDRLADQADYTGALERYTEAYHAVVSRIRGQKFSTRVLPTLLTREELGQEMIRMMKKEYTPEEFALMDASYKALGLAPSDLQSEELITKLLTEEVAGFYDPDNQRMVLIRENGSDKDPGFFGRLLGVKPAFDKTEQKTTLAHEMTHALQDQLYGLKAMQKRIEHDDDMLLAFSALAEGDATLLMLAEMEGGSDITEMDPEVIRATFTLTSWMLPLADGKTYRKAPAIFRDSLVFPYFQGMIFCISLTGKEGWPALHAAYSDPPASSEQIMHPEKYLGPERDDPRQVTIPDLKNLLPETYKHLGGNCLGEFQTSVMLKRLRSGRRASTGWDGDRYEVFQRNDGGLGLVFVSVWDSEKDAEEFAKAFREYRDPTKTNDDSSTPADANKPEAKETKESESEKENQPQSKAATERVVESHGDQVWIIEGFDPSETEAIKAKLSECHFEIKRVPKD